MRHSGAPHNEVTVAIRRRNVLRYYLRGLTPEEIVRQLQAMPGMNASRATLYRDLQELRVLMAQKIEAEQLWTVRRAVALREELMREAWRIYHLPAERKVVGRGEEQHEVEVDPSFRQLMAINTLAKVSEQLDRLAFGAKVHVTQTIETQSPEDLKAIDELSENEQVVVARAIKLVETKGRPSST